MARGRSTVRRTVRAQRVDAANASLRRIARARMSDAGTTEADNIRDRAAILSLRQRAVSASRSAARAAIGSASKGPTSGQYSSSIVQQTKSSSSSRLGRKTSAAQTALKLTKAQLETVIHRWNGAKAFDTNGYYWMSNFVNTAGRRDMPLYLFDLTSVHQNPSGTTALPFVQLSVETATGVAAFTPQSHFASSGGAMGSGGTSWGLEKQPLSTDQGIPLNKSFLKSVSIKMNCWGAKTKATTYTIQLVKFLDDDLVPNHLSYAADLAGATSKRTDFYQNLMKSLTYNPISQTGGSFKGRMKVLKSENFIIQPNDTSDGDTDPNVRTLSMYVAMNRVISYLEQAAFITTVANLSDDADYAENSQAMNKPQTRPKSRVYLMIRASNYKLDTSNSNTDTPSFDLVIRANHQMTK